MTNLSSVSGGARSHTALAAAIVIAAVLISTTLFMTSSASDATTTETITETSTTVEMTTLLQSATTTSPKMTNSSKLRVYELVFQQLPCAGEIVSPWAVTLDNQTVVEPSNETVPTDSMTKLVPPSFNLTTIVFSVTPGNYDYTFSPTGIWNQTSIHDFGFITVAGSDLTVQIQATCHT